MNLQIAIRNRILQLCEEQDISINRLAARSGLAQSTVAGIFQRDSTKVTTLAQLCEGLGITLFEFFSTEDFKNLDPQ